MQLLFFCDLFSRSYWLGFSQTKICLPISYLSQKMPPIKMPPMFPSRSMRGGGIRTRGYFNYERLELTGESECKLKDYDDNYVTLMDLQQQFESQSPPQSQSPPLPILNRSPSSSSLFSLFDSSSAPTLPAAIELEMMLKDLNPESTTSPHNQSLLSLEEREARLNFVHFLLISTLFNESCNATR